MGGSLTGPVPPAPPPGPQEPAPPGSGMRVSGMRVSGPLPEPGVPEPPPGRAPPGPLLSRGFFARPAQEVAPGLLGCVLCHDTADGVVAIMITETEAYAGTADAA